ncbi:MAG: hypothetical protein ACHP7N_02870 [Caulobacterales bacterium]
MRWVRLIGALWVAAAATPATAATYNFHHIWPAGGCDAPPPETIDVPAGRISIHHHIRNWNSGPYFGIPLWWGFQRWEPEQNGYTGLGGYLNVVTGPQFIKPVSSNLTPPSPVAGGELDYTEADDVIKPFRMQVQIGCKWGPMEIWLTITTAAATQSNQGTSTSNSSSNVARRPVTPDPLTGLSLQGDLLLQTMNTGGVSNGPKQPSVFRSAKPVRITGIVNYHWNNGQGAAPGTIALRGANGVLYGPWRARGAPGAGGAQNVMWYVEPGVVLPPGAYTVIDSDPATWSQDALSGNRGMGEVRAASP